MSEDEWGDLECLYVACQASITDGGLFTDTGKQRKDREQQANSKAESSPSHKKAA